MSNYHYFAASLPYLSIGTPPPIRFHYFLSLCREHLSSYDFSALMALESEKDTFGKGITYKELSHPFVQKWRNFLSQLNNAIITLRAKFLAIDPLLYINASCNEFSLYIENSVKYAFEQENPLEKELILDRLRWEESERIGGFNIFSGNAILGYSIRLHIAERWASLNETKGHEVVDKLIQSVKF